MCEQVPDRDEAPTSSVEFWSSVGAHPFQRALMESLAGEGVANREHCAVSQDEYRAARGFRRRLGLRLRTYVQYPWQVARRFRHAPLGTCAVISSNTFFAPWVAMRAARSQSRVVHWVLDLYPDALIVAGKLGHNAASVGWMRRVMRDAFDRAAANVFLGGRLLEYAEQKFGPIPRAHVIPVGADGRPFAGTAPASRGASPCRILYCGNLGHLHEVDTLAAILGADLPPNLELDFRGNGAGMTSLARQVGGGGASRVRFGPNLPDREWTTAMAEAEVALVTMREGAQGVVLPSKAYSALVAGQAILAVCPLDSDLADLVTAHDAGWVIAPGNPRGLLELLGQIADDPSARLAKRRNAWRAGQAHYDQAIIAKTWRRLLQALPGSS